MFRVVLATLLSNEHAPQESVSLPYHALALCSSMFYGTNLQCFQRF